jgi:hypothetical protein
MRIEVVSAVATMAMVGGQRPDEKGQDGNDQNDLYTHIAYLLKGRCNR